MLEGHQQHAGFRAQVQNYMSITTGSIQQEQYDIPRRAAATKA